MGKYALFADAFCYPSPGRKEQILTGLQAETDRKVSDAITEFIDQIEEMTIGEWEELHTRTLDLSPLVAPYVGYQIWGESYQRGNFMALINRRLRDYQIDLDGELPDHLVPILRLMDRGTDQPEELKENLEPAIKKMTSELRKRERDNPYLILIDALHRMVSGDQTSSERLQ